MRPSVMVQKGVFFLPEYWTPLINMLLAGAARETRTARWQWLKNKFFYEVYEYVEKQKSACYVSAVRCC